MNQDNFSKLELANRWFSEGRCFIRWVPRSQAILRRVKEQLDAELRPQLNFSCAHLKGRGGVKGAIRRAARATDRFPFVARFDIQGYYENIDHTVLMDQLQKAGVSPAALYP